MTTNDDRRRNSHCFVAWLAAQLDYRSSAVAEACGVPTKSPEGRNDLRKMMAVNSELLKWAFQMLNDRVEYRQQVEVM